MDNNNLTDFPVNNGNAPNQNTKPNLVKPANNGNQPFPKNTPPSPQNVNGLPPMQSQGRKNPNGNPVPTNMQQNPAPQNRPLNNQAIIPPPPLQTPPQKKKSGCLIPIIIAIIVFVIIAILVVGIVVFVFLKKDDKGTSESNDSSVSVSSESELEGESSGEPVFQETSEESVKPDETSEKPTEAANHVDYKKLYAGIVGDVFNSGKNSWGEELYSIYDNQFAVYDIDGDGHEELIFSITGTYTGGMTMTIYDYNNKGEAIEQFSCFPYATFYDNGAIWVGASHNQGLAGEFWPHSLYSYDADSNSYEDEGYVDAWSKEAFPTNFSDEPYPDYIDKSKSGYVYYIYPPNDFNEVKPVDEAEYIKWNDGIIGNAKEIMIPFKNLTEENIKTLDPTFTDTSGRPPEGDRTLAPKDMEIGEYLGSGNTITKATMYMGPDTEYDAIISIPEDSYLSIYGYNKKWCYVSYSSSTYTYSGYVKTENIESVLFGDAIGKIKIATKKDPLNIRASKSIDGKKVGEIPKGEIVPYYEYDDGWYKVKYNGKEGYVSGEYVIVQ